MQVFRLVDAGRVDRLIGFDKLPDSILAGIRRGSSRGLARHWQKFLDVDSKDENPRPFYTLDFKYRNDDQDHWSEINSYVRRNAPKDERLLDKLEDMSIPMAPNSHVAVTLEPEDIPIIRIESEAEKVVEALKQVDESQKKPNEFITPEPDMKDKRKGRKLSAEHIKKMVDARKRKAIERRKVTVT